MRPNPRCSLAPAILRAQPPTHTTPDHGQNDRLTFGIEMELTLQPTTPHQHAKTVQGYRLDFGQTARGQDTYTWAKVAQLLAYHPQMKNLRVNWSQSPVNLDYTTWNIVPDDTINTAPHCHQLVSRHGVSLPYPKGWEVQLRTIWEVLSDHFNIRPSTSCSTHIHVSLPSKWTLPQSPLQMRCLL